MGLQDRDYARVGPRSRSGLGRVHGLSFNTWLIILNIAVFLVDPLLGAGLRQSVVVGRQLTAVPTGGVIHVQQGPAPLPPVGSQYSLMLADGSGTLVGVQYMRVMTPLQAWGHFSTAKAFVHFAGGQPLFGLEVWRFLSFQFLHAGFVHIAMNLLGLWVFGGLVEQQLGRRRYAAFYLACGMAGAAAYLALNFLGSQLGVRIPGVLTGDPHTPLVGASAGVFGVIVAAAKIAPNEMVQLLFPPVPLRLKYMAYTYVGLAVANLLFGGQNAGGDAAHVGGAIAGFFLIRNSHWLREFLDVFGPPGSPRRDSGESDQAEVDRILAKVRERGLGSLSSREKRVLQRDTERRRREA